MKRGRREEGGGRRPYVPSGPEGPCTVSSQLPCTIFSMHVPKLSEIDVPVSADAKLDVLFMYGNVPISLARVVPIIGRFWP